MNPPLETLLDLAGAHARLALVEIKMRSLMPTWLLFNQTGAPMIVGTPWKDDEDKMRIRKLMRAHMRKLGVVAYSFVCEAWTAQVEAHEFDLQEMALYDENRRPHRRADREEVVMACACDQERILWRQWRIVRAPTTEIIVDLKLKEFPLSDQQPEGWLAEMLK